MIIEEGDGFELTTGRTVRVGSILDTYSRYETEEQIGHDPETHVRYSNWWHGGRLIASRMVTLDVFQSKIVRQVPDEELPASKEPSER